MFDRLRHALGVMVMVVGLTVGALLGAPAHAQQASPSSAPTSSAKVVTPEDLAKSVHNPFADFIKLPLQATTGFSIGPHHNAGEALNIEPLIPFSLSPQWDLMARPSLSATYQPSPNEQYGLNDLQSSFFLTPHDADEWIWGAGPVFQFPTATSDAFGTGRWCAGPTAALLYDNGPWFGGVVTYQLMSFAGDRARGSVNQTYLEPEVSYNFDSGWYVDVDPPMTFDWTADAANGWTVPIGADVGDAFNVGSHAMSWQIGAYDLAKRPQGNPQWIIRIQLMAMFPTGW